MFDFFSPQESFWFWATIVGAITYTCYHLSQPNSKSKKELTNSSNNSNMQWEIDSLIRRVSTLEGRIAVLEQVNPND